MKSLFHSIHYDIRASNQQELDFASRLYYKLYKVTEDAISEANILNEAGSVHRIEDD